MGNRAAGMDVVKPSWQQCWHLLQQLPQEVQQHPQPSLQGLQSTRTAAPAASQPPMAQLRAAS